MSNPYKVAFWVLLGVLLAPTVLLGGCSLAYRYATVPQELARVTSPSGTVDAVLLKVATLEGATGDGRDDLYLVPVGERIEDSANPEKVLGIEEVDNLRRGIELHWADDGLLEIRYEAAAILDFKNFAYIPGERDEEIVVELRLEAPKGEPGLPKEYLDDPLL